MKDLSLANSERTKIYLAAIGCIMVSAVIGLAGAIDFRILLIVFVMAGAVIAIWRPEIFLVIMLPVYFRFLGFVSRGFLASYLGTFELRDLVFVLLLVLTCLACLQNPHLLRELRNSVLFYPTIVLVTYVVIRIILTALNYGDLFLSIRTGRRYLSYLLYFPAIVFLSNRRKAESVASLLIYFGALIALINIFAQLAPAWFLQFYDPEFGQLSTLDAYGATLGVKIHVVGRFFMFLALAWVFFRWINGQSKSDLILLVILTMGFIAQKYRTFYVVLPLSMMLSWFAIGKNNRQTFRQLLRLMSLFLSSMLLGIAVIISNSGLREGVSLFIWEAWASLTGEIETGTFQDRLQNADWRLDLFRNHPLIGEGFVHDQVALRLGYPSGVSITYVGYADVLVTGGIVLMLILAVYILVSTKYLYRFLHAARRLGIAGDQIWIPAGTLAYVIAATLGMVTWSLLTIDEGILPMVFALAASERYLHFVRQERLAYPIANSRAERIKTQYV